MKRPEFNINHILNNKSISGEHWMTNLSPLLRQLPLIYLCIPGTIESKRSNITLQLFNGIRYLHISTYKYKRNWLCSPDVKLYDVLRQISLFGVCHPNEIIFIELKIISQFYNEIECLNIIIQRLLPLLMTKTTNEFWISKLSINSICNTGKNIILINNKYAHRNERIFSSCTKYICTSSINKLDHLLNQVPSSICSTYQIPQFSIKIMWCVKSKFDFMKCVTHKLVTLSRNTIIDYVTNSDKNITNLNKISIFCIECGDDGNCGDYCIDVLYLCMQIMEQRFFQ